jgi:CubicO group peptidase (beta-lactamase class C family)
VDLAYGWAWASTDRSRLARMIVWQESDVSDYRRFPARPVPTRPPVFRFRRSPAADRVPVATVPIREGGRLVERDLEGFLRSTGTTVGAAGHGGGDASSSPPLDRRLDQRRHPDRPLAPVRARLVDPTRLRPPNDFWAQGNHGQFVYVSPGRNVVLVRFGTDYNYDHRPDLLAGLARRL